MSSAAKPRLDDAAELLGLDATAFDEAMTVKSVGKFPVVQVPLIATDDLPCMQVLTMTPVTMSGLPNVVQVLQPPAKATATL